MIKVFFETPNFTYCELVGTFENEALYMACLPSLEKVAKEHGYIVTESLQDNDPLEEARILLKSAGYYTDNLWNIQDVKGNFKCTDEWAYTILDKSLNSEWIMEQIWYTIKEVRES